MGLLLALKLRAELFERDRAVRRQAREFAALCLENGVIDLRAARVHRADDKPVDVRGILRHGLERRNAEARLVCGPGKALDRRNADAKARERARPRRDWRWH